MGERQALTAGCPNCGREIVGRFCPVCGQDTERHLASVLSFGRNALAEITDVRGPVWRTLRTVVRRPGLLTREYAERKFRSQVSPLRLYLATAAIYFLLMPFWGEWTVRVEHPDGSSTTRSVETNFPSPVVFGLLVPLWAGAVQLAVADRRKYFEEAFVFSAHYHVVLLMLVTAAGAVWSLLVRFGFLEIGTTLMGLALLGLPIYVHIALRAAFGLTRARAAVTAVALVGLQAAMVGVLSQW